MSAAPKLICLVTPATIANVPRVVQQGEALHAAGYRVHVIFGTEAEGTAPASSWPCTGVRPTRGVSTGIRRAFARRMLPFAPFATMAVATRVHGAEWAPLAEAAIAVDAHYYIGHRVSGIAAAAVAADRTQVRFGGDLDALFEDVTSDPAADPVLRAAVRIILATTLPRASHLTAASTDIARAFAARYGVHAETVAELSTSDAADRATLLRLIKNPPDAHEHSC